MSLQTPAESHGLHLGGKLFFLGGARFFAEDVVDHFPEFAVGLDWFDGAGEFFLDIEHEAFGTFEAGLEFFDQDFEFPDFFPQDDGDVCFVHGEFY
jgi:hypothetical protein